MSKLASLHFLLPCIRKKLPVAGSVGEEFYSLPENCIMIYLDLNTEGGIKI